MTLQIHQRRRGRARSPLLTANVGSTAPVPKWRARSGTPCLVVFVLLLAWQAAHAQTADEFFNSGAQLYISNNIPSALEQTESGLKLYPNDEKLKKLEKLLKQQQQSQSQQNQQQQQNQQNQQSQSQKQQQEKNQQSQQQQNQSQQNQQQQKQNQSAQQKQPQNQSGQKEKSAEETKQGKEMTPEEAKQLLDSQKGNEQVLQFSPKGKPENQNQPVKDW